MNGSVGVPDETCKVELVHQMRGSMKLCRSCVVILGVGFSLPSVVFGGGDVKKKEEVVASIEKQRAELVKLSDQIWAFAETALLETKSSKVLAAHAEKQGFQRERGV